VKESLDKDGWALTTAGLDHSASWGAASKTDPQHAWPAQDRSRDSIAIYRSDPGSIKWSRGPSEG